MKIPENTKAYYIVEYSNSILGPQIIQCKGENKPFTSIEYIDGPFLTYSETARWLSEYTN